MTQRMKAIVSYEGTKFSGFQVQDQYRTIQGEIEKALTKIHKGQQIRIQASGRTDAGVHAKGQVIHFDTELRLGDYNWRKALNTLLPDDIRIVDITGAEEGFHARYNAKRKQYKYFIHNAPEQDVFKRHYVHHVPYNLDFDRIQQAIQVIEGTHDFTAFCSARAEVKGEKIRTIYEAACEKQDDMIVLTFTGNGFLYNMVRILAGTLIAIGNGRKEPEDMASILASKDRQLASKTAAASGLFLWKVEY
ncbi:tRNA pseudouridine(38-40) synthase TruA [Terribacillus sp. DMT04]|uniref:tRNA pseudouridine(38-40) synthase TruA n=1 Tax=Terribacillus sp. DMT04 TaxID=2850441 RepID=UPI001C2BFF47|nr:tRNA pseudouridine(38-40) synthase TruA [Terribacillus sp. DMT04]QXE01886.1 tRNA pseudouridine(38-40) synthase TruA [Terribacillus sp. DMT04]